MAEPIVGFVLKDHARMAPWLQRAGVVWAPKIDHQMLLSTELMDLLKDCYWEASLPEDLPNFSREVEKCGHLLLTFSEFYGVQNSTGWFHPDRGLRSHLDGD